MCVVLSVNSDSGGGGGSSLRPPFGSQKDKKNSAEVGSIKHHNAQCPKTGGADVYEQCVKHFLPKQDESKLSGLLEDCRGWRSDTWRGRLQRRGSGGVCVGGGGGYLASASL